MPKIFDLMEAMHDRGCPPDAVTYNTALAGCVCVCVCVCVRVLGAVLILSSDGMVDSIGFFSAIPGLCHGD